jgi:hypothetical protein
MIMQLLQKLNEVMLYRPSPLEKDKRMRGSTAVKEKLTILYNKGPVNF